MSITTYNVEIIIAHGELKAIMEWCEENCCAEWQFMVDRNHYRSYWFEYLFLFDSEQDAVLFTLRWL
jgi:hypothetical protein